MKTLLIIVSVIFVVSLIGMVYFTHTAMDYDPSWDE